MAGGKLRAAGWLAAYGLTMAIVAAALVAARQWALEELGSPQAIAQWRSWKAAEEARAADPTAAGPRRRPPTSLEPPGLIVLRDHFVPVAATCLVVATFLFGFVAWLGAGMSRRPARASWTDDPHSP